jgi:hypothetical protein
MSKSMTRKRLQINATENTSLHCSTVRVLRGWSARTPGPKACGPRTCCPPTSRNPVVTSVLHMLGSRLWSVRHESSLVVSKLSRVLVGQPNNVFPSAGPSTSGGIPRQSHLPRSKSAGKRVANQQPLVPMSDTSTKEVFAEIDALMDRIRGSTAPPGGAPPIKRTEHGISAYQDPRSKLTPWKPLGFPTRDVGPIAGGSVAVGSGASTSLDFAATAPPSMLSSRGEGAPMPSALAEKSSRPLAVYQNRLPHSLGLSVAPVISPPKHGSHEAPSVGEAAGSTDPSHGEAAGSMLPSVTASAVLTYKVCGGRDPPSCEVQNHCL